MVAGVLVFLAGVQLFVFPLRTERYFAWTIDVADDRRVPRRGPTGRAWCSSGRPLDAPAGSTPASRCRRCSCSPRSRWWPRWCTVDKFHFGSEFEDVDPGRHLGVARRSTSSCRSPWSCCRSCRAASPASTRPASAPLAIWVRVVIALEAVLLLGVGWRCSSTPRRASADVVAVDADPADRPGDRRMVHRARRRGRARLVGGRRAPAATGRPRVRGVRRAPGHRAARATATTLDWDRPASWVYVGFLVSAAVVGGSVMLAARGGNRPRPTRSTCAARPTPRRLPPTGRPSASEPSLRRPAPRRDPPALRPAPAVRRRAAVVGGAEGAVARPQGPAARGSGGRPHDAGRRLRGRVRGGGPRGAGQ